MTDLSIFPVSKKSIARRSIDRRDLIRSSPFPVSISTILSPFLKALTFLGGLFFAS